MRRWLILGLAALTVGCYDHDVQISLHPLFEEGDVVELPQVVGTWIEEGENPRLMTVQPVEDELYSITFARGEKESRCGLVVAFGRIGDGVELYWNLTALPLEEESALWAQHRLPVHSFARVTLEGDRLEIARLDQKWVEQALADSRIDVAHVVVDNDVILTAPPAELQQLLREHADDEGAFGDRQVFTRRPSSE